MDVNIEKTGELRGMKDKMISWKGKDRKMRKRGKNRRIREGGKDRVMTEGGTDRGMTVEDGIGRGMGDEEWRK